MKQVLNTIGGFIPMNSQAEQAFFQVPQICLFGVEAHQQLKVQAITEALIAGLPDATKMLQAFLK